MKIKKRPLLFIALLFAITLPRPAAAPQSFRRSPRFSPTGMCLPNVVSWNTFQGSYAYDEAADVAVDGLGNVYITGTSRSDWGHPVNPFDLSFYGSDAFAAKLDRGGALLWHTFLGNGYDIVPCGIALDGYGGIYVAGSNKLNPGTSKEVVIVKLDGDGNRIWSKTYGSYYGHVTARAMALDRSGNLFVAGSFPESCCGFYDGFVSKFDPDGNRLWTRLLNWTTADACRAIALDGAGDAYIAGDAYSPGNFDVFIVKIDHDGALRWTTFLGSGTTDKGLAIAVDGGGNIYAAGYSSASWGAPVNGYSGGNDAFAAKLDNNGNPIWNTFFGGAGDDGVSGLAVDGEGDVYLAGYSGASWGAPQNPHSGLSDIMLAKIDTDGNRLWHTFFGGEGNDQAAAVALDADGHVYLAGSSGAAWGMPLNSHRGGEDAVVVKMAQAFTVSFSAEIGGQLAGATTQVVDYGGDCSPVTAVPDSYNFFLNWTGTGDFVTTTLNPAVVTNVTEDMTIAAHFRKILPPIRGHCERVQNRSLSQVEYINMLRWSANPGNADLAVSAFRVYEIVGGMRVLMSQVGPLATEYRHRKAGTVSRTYHIVCVVNGVEGEPLIITL